MVCRRLRSGADKTFRVRSPPQLGQADENTIRKNNTGLESLALKSAGNKDHNQLAQRCLTFPSPGTPQGRSTGPQVTNIQVQGLWRFKEASKTGQHCD